MSKPKRINLNDFERVEKETDLEGYQAVILTPLKVKIGDEWMQPEDLYFRKPVRGERPVENISNAVWHKDVVISTLGSDYDYGRRVKWYFDNALEDVEFKGMINDTFDKNGFNIRQHLEWMQPWLKKQTLSCRKSHLKKFIWDHLTKDYNKHISYLQKR